MLSYILAIAVALGSFILYMAAFFFPEVHRKGDFWWSGVGMFYALVLWFCAGRMTGAVLLGETASVALIGWFGWQMLRLRREVTPSRQRTPVPEAPVSQNVSQLGKVGSLFKRKPKETATSVQSKMPVQTPPPASPEQVTESLDTATTMPLPEPIVVEMPLSAEAVVEATATPPEILNPEIPPVEEAFVPASLETPVSEMPPSESEAWPQSIETIVEETAEIPPESVELPPEMPVAEEMAEILPDSIEPPSEMPAAAAMPGAETEVEAPEVFDEMDEFDEDELDEDTLEPATPPTKTVDKKPATTKPAAKPKQKAGIGNLIAPVSGLLVGLQTQLQGLLNKTKKSKPTVKKSTPPTPTPPDISDLEDEFEDESPLEVDATLVQPVEDEEKATLVPTEDEEQELEPDAASEGSEISPAPEVSQETISAEKAPQVTEEMTSAAEAEVTDEAYPQVEEMTSAAEAEVTYEAPTQEIIEPVLETPEPEAIHPDAPPPALVESAQKEPQAPDIPIEEVAPDAELAPPAEATIETTEPSLIVVETTPEPITDTETCISEEPVSEATLNPEEAGFAPLVRPKRPDAALVEATKHSAEASTKPMPPTPGNQETSE